MPSEHIVHFMSDGCQLTGTLHLPDQPKPAVIIGCHGLLAHRQSPKQIALAETLNQMGLAFLRFDHRGCGDSQGTQHAAELLAARCRDLYHAMTFLQSHSRTGPVVGLFGSSFGGTVVMAAAAEHPMPLLITFAAPVHSGAIHDGVVREIQQHNTIRADSLAQFHFDIRPQLPLLKNILVMHSEADEIVPVNHAGLIHEAAQEPKRVVIYKRGDHRMSDPSYQRRFLEECRTWCRERLGASLGLLKQ
ncbi:MAG: alpha/beta fold hydrolase [Desulfobacteraceae bacterium]|nr:alpha/beta fold hydrolase [Desulfobacteraceae bacterium]